MELSSPRLENLSVKDLSYISSLKFILYFGKWKFLALYPHAMPFLRNEILYYLTKIPRNMSFRGSSVLINLNLEK